MKDLNSVFNKGNKKRGALWGLVLAVTILLSLIPAESVWATSGTISLSATATTLNIGDTVTITATPKASGVSIIYATVTFSYDTSKFAYVSYSAAGMGGGDGNILLNAEGESVSITLKALAEGSATVTVTADNGFDYDTEDSISPYTSASKTFTISNSSSSTTLSGNNSLKSLSISPGTLSPTFSSSTTKYTATVANSVTSIAVDAQLSSSKATIKSVSGNTNLSVGTNTIKIVVEAENGVTATYTITVTRLAAGETMTTEEPEETTEETEAIAVEIDGVTWYLNADLPEENALEEYAKKTMEYQEETIEAYSISYENLSIVYLAQLTDGEETEGAYFVYDSQTGEFFPYVSYVVGSHRVLILPLTYADALTGAYSEESFVIGAFAMSGYYMESLTDGVTEEEVTREFYLVYGVNEKGSTGWYQYDATEDTLQRCNTALYEAAELNTLTEGSYLTAYNTLSERYQTNVGYYRLAVAALIVLFLIAAFLALDFALFGKPRKKKDAEEEEEELSVVDLENL